jgi:hypothetical protein
MAGDETASRTNPQQMHVLYDPYQSRSMIIDPLHLGQTRGSVACISFYDLPSRPERDL